MSVTTPIDVELLELEEVLGFDELLELEVEPEPPEDDEVPLVEPEDGLLVGLAVGRGFGVAVTVNDEPLVAEPVEVVTVMGPLFAPAGTMVLTWVSLTTW